MTYASQFDQKAIMASSGSSKKKPKVYHGKYLVEWELQTEFKGFIKPSPEGHEYAYCLPCGKSVKVAASGKFDLERHFQTEGHKNSVKKSKQHVPLNVWTLFHV
eukprot:TRINITY_DN33562_c0_g1_i15.p1 TRINITY_DN33562_c0_g1~~TRINITY_DN33562_c0_g1_i15.p1  ORF type:complete len:104 (+),score=17.24 TRINITY_DN33562_c0_g1_i15:524-835(+)